MSATPRTRPGTSVQSASIVIVEDERIVALDLSMRLAEMGYTVLRTVARGEDGAGDPVGERRLADALRAADQPGMREPPGAKRGEEGFLAGGRVLQQLDEFGGLLLGERQRRDAEGGTFGDMGTVGFKHGDFLTRWR